MRTIIKKIKKILNNFSLLSVIGYEGKSRRLKTTKNVFVKLPFSYISKVKHESQLGIAHYKPGFRPLFDGPVPLHPS